MASQQQRAASPMRELGAQCPGTVALPSLLPWAQSMRMRKQTYIRTCQKLPAPVHNSAVQKYSEDTKFLIQYQNDQKARTMTFPKE